MIDWDDPTLREKVSRRKVKENDFVKKAVICTNCDRNVFARGEDPCRCSIWDVGKIPVTA